MVRERSPAGCLPSIYQPHCCVYTLRIHAHMLRIHVPRDDAKQQVRDTFPRHCTGIEPCWGRLGGGAPANNSPRSGSDRSTQPDPPPSGQRLTPGRRRAQVSRRQGTPGASAAAAAEPAWPHPAPCYQHAALPAPCGTPCQEPQPFPGDLARAGTPAGPTAPHRAL